MRYLLLLLLVVFISCYKSNKQERIPSIKFKLVSMSNKNYSFFSKKPTTNLTFSFDDINTYIPNFSTEYDTVEIMAKNLDNFKEYYFRLNFKSRIIDNTEKGEARVEFYDFNHENINFDSIKYINNILWLYCE